MDGREEKDLIRGKNRKAKGTTKKAGSSVEKQVP